MNASFSIRDEFGSHLADGTEAAYFRLTKVDAYVGISPEITLDFTGVRNANSSFINALVARLIEQHGLKVLEKVIFKGCNRSVKVLIEAAVDLGASKVAGSADFLHPSENGARMDRDDSAYKFEKDCSLPMIAFVIE